MENTFPDLDPIRQLANKVVSFSSQYGGENSRTYGALNLVGNGNIFPNYGDYTQAFVLVCWGCLSFLWVNDRMRNKNCYIYVPCDWLRILFVKYREYYVAARRYEISL